jgi:hypothetical protein
LGLFDSKEILVRIQLPALALLAAAAPAWAGSAHSSATVHGLTLTVVDLAPGDGIEARARFSALPYAGSYLSASIYDDKGEYADGTFQVIDHPFRPASVAHNGASASALSFFTATHQGYGAGAFGSLPSGPKSGAYRATSALGVQVELTPHTALEWRGTYALTAFAESDPDLVRPQTPLASFHFGEYGKQEWRYASATSRNPWDGPNMDFRSGSFGFTMTNDTGSLGHYSGGLGLHASGGFVAQAVPEPETYAMLLAGVGAVGFVARRRKAAA